MASAHLDAGCGVPVLYSLSRVFTGVVENQSQRAHVVCRYSTGICGFFAIEPGVFGMEACSQFLSVASSWLGISGRWFVIVDSAGVSGCSPVWPVFSLGWTRFLAGCEIGRASCRERV